MKKFLSILLAVITAFALCISSAAIRDEDEREFAVIEDGKLNIVVDGALEKNEAKPSDEVDLKIRFKNNTGIISCIIYLSFDEQLSVVINNNNGPCVTFSDDVLLSDDVSKGCYIMSDGRLKIDWVSPKDILTEDVVFVTVKVRVADDAVIGTFLPVTVQVKDADDVFDYDMENVDFNPISGGIDVTQDYNVRFFNYDGSVISEDVCRYGETPVAPENPERASDDTFCYVFAGWDKEIAPCTADVDYTAEFTAAYIDYTVVFKDHDGSVISTNTYHYGDEVTVPDDPVRADDDKYTYTFTGWDKEVTICGGSAEYTAQYDRSEKRLRGDINNDGKVNNKDVVFLFRAVTGGTAEGAGSVYDFNEDGKVNNKDVVALFRYITAQ